MPAPAIPANVLVADLVIRTNRKMLRSRLYYTSDTPPDDETDLTVIADQVKVHFTPSLPNLLPTLNYFSRVECRWYGAGSAFFFANSTAAEGAGLISSPMDSSEDGGSETEDVMPDGSAIIIQKKTGKRGPSKQGRLFIGGIAEAVNFAGEVTPGLVATTKVLAGKVAADITINTGGVVTVLHARHWDRKNNIMEPITKTYVVKGLADLNRRRAKILAERL